MKQKIELLIRSGHLKEALEAFREVKLNKVPREEALDYAQIASRIGQLQAGLKILNPIVRGENLRVPAQELEKIQYANLLRKLGAVEEAMEILCEIDAEKNPDASLNLAFCHSTQWQYEKAIPHLRAYLKTFKESSYKSLVGQVNLLAALIHENHLDEAQTLAFELQQEAARLQASLLLGNIWELTAQLQIKERNWKEAVGSLDKASALLHQAKDSPDALYIEKWRAVVSSLEKNEPSEYLFHVRDRALQLNQWETLRDCEFYLAKLTGHHQTLFKLYFGTPFQSYRQRILQALGGETTIPEFYNWTEKPNPDLVFDLVEAQATNGSASLPVGQVLHRLLVLLSQDFYKPLPLISIFAKLFPGDHFNPYTSPNRTHQVIKRLRKWFVENKVPMQIEEIASGYRLKLAPSCCIRIPQEAMPLQGEALEILRLKKALPQSEFTAKEVREVLSLSRSETQRLLRSALDAGLVENVGFTNQSRYRKIA